MPLPLGHVEAGLHLVYETLDGRVADTPQRTPRFWWAATTKALAGRLSEGVQQEASVSLALVSFLHLDGKSGDQVEGPSCVHVAERTSEPILTPLGISIDDTKLDPSDRPAKGRADLAATGHATWWMCEETDTGSWQLISTLTIR